MSGDAQLNGQSTSTLGSSPGYSLGFDRSDAGSGLEGERDNVSMATSATSAAGLQNGHGSEDRPAADPIVTRFERDVKIRDGAEHFLSTGNGVGDLQEQVLQELLAAHARIATAYLLHQSLLITTSSLQDMLHTAASLAVRSNDALAGSSNFEDAHDDQQELASALYIRVASILDSNARIRHELSAEALVAGTFAALGDESRTDLRAAVYSLLRHALVDPPWKLMAAYRREGLDIYVSRTLLRDQQCTVEKEQALKLLRSMMELGSLARSFDDAATMLSNSPADVLISPATIRAIASAADVLDEPLRNLVIETLGELSLLAPHELAAGGGTRCLMQATSDASNELAPELVIVLLCLIDIPATRKILKPGLDIDGSLSALTESRDSSDAELVATAQLAGIMLRSWTGFLYLCHSNKAALRALLLSLSVHTERVQSTILDIFAAFLSSEATGKEAGTSKWKPRFRPLETPTQASRINLVESYKLLVANTLLSCGIMKSLVSILEMRPALSEKALGLMEQLRALTAGALPAHCSYKMHALPEIVLTRFKGGEGGDEQQRASTKEVASNVLATLDEFNTRRLRAGVAAQNSDRFDSASGAPIVPTLVDDGTFRTLLLEANVLGTKDHTKWSYEALHTLFGGVLLHPKRLEEALRASKLVRRVLAFYHPFAMRYSTLQRTNSNGQYTKLGCAIMQSLLSSPDGVRFLAEDRLLTEFAECLETDIMSERRLEITIAGGYFEMIGVLSRSPEGLEVLHETRLFTALFKAIDSSRRADLARYLLDSLDFEVEGLGRIMLGRILAHPSRAVRLEATRRAAEVARKDTSKWLVRLLVNQLYDPAGDVRELASNVLLRECTRSTKTLQMVVSMRPMLDEGAHALLIKFLSTSHGFQYLMQGDYIDREIDEWFHHRNVVYATELEVLLSRAFSHHRAKDDAQLAWDGSVPPHFYGELVKTPEGRAVLADKGHFAEFAHFVRQRAAEQDDAEVLLKLKSILWAIGNMGASAGGVSFLEEEEIVATIVKMADTTQVFSLRGTCYFALSMIASTQQGAELVQDEGWEVAVSHTLEADGPYGVCLPADDFFHLSYWETWWPAAPAYLRPPEDRLEREIMTHISSLGNAILVTKSSRALTKLKERHPRKFLVPSALQQWNTRRSSTDTTASGDTVAPNQSGDSSSAPISADGPQSPKTADAKVAEPHIPASFPPALSLFVRALHLMDTHPIRPSVRRYLWELFEARLDASLVRAVQECHAQLVIPINSSPKT